MGGSISDHIEDGHHRHVFVFQVVTMKDVSAAEGSELDEDHGLVVRSELDRILS